MHVKIRKLSNDLNQNSCILPKDIFEELNLSDDVLYSIHLGQICKNLYVMPSNEIGDFLYLPYTMFNEFLLFSNLSLNLWRKDNNIYLGPVVGVFVSTRYLKAIESGDVPISAEKHMQANEEAKCLTYYFSIDSINWYEKKVRGYTYVAELGKWKKYWFPLPDVVYDRGVRFTPEQKLLVKHIREQFNYSPEVEFINNQDCLGKWQVYKRISKYPEISSYIPKTIKYENFNNVLFMLKQHDYIFIKSSYGSRGREVLSVEHQDNKFTVTFFEKGLKQYTYYDTEELQNCVESFVQKKQFIIQQGIRLIKYKRRNMDMRVLLEKDNSGKWQAIYNQSRIAKGDLTITNYSAGGDITNYEDIYHYLINSECQNRLPDYDEIAKITIEIASYIERTFGSFGELGMDMALDIHGRVWFIEANTKPDKDPEPGLEDTVGISPQALSIFEYAKYLKKGECKYE